MLAEMRDRCAHDWRDGGRTFAILAIEKVKAPCRIPDLSVVLGLEALI